MIETNEHKIAKQLVDLYKGLDPSKMTDNEKNILSILNALENKCVKFGSSGWNPDEIDFFRKLIKEYEEVFGESTNVNTKYEGRMPKPIFRTHDYDFTEQVWFWKVYIENLYTEDDKERRNMKRPNRKSNYNYNQKIDIEQNYDFVMQMLKDLKPNKNYPNLNYTPEKNLYNIYRDMIRFIAISIAKEYEDNKEKIQNSGKTIYDCEIIYVLNLLNVWIMLKNVDISDIFNLLKLWINLDKTNIHDAIEFINVWNNIKDTNISYIITNFDPSIVQKIFYVQWDLWIYVIMQNFHYLFKHNSITKSDTSDIINKIQEIGTEIQYQRNLKNSSNISDAYFNYNYLLKIRTWVNGKSQVPRPVTKSLR